MWKEKENLIQKFIEENLEMESKDTIIERVYRTGFKINDKKKDIMLKFLNHKDKDAAQNQYRQKQLWIDNVYVNEDYRERTAKLRKELFEQAKEIRQSGKFYKLCIRNLWCQGSAAQLQFSLIEFQTLSFSSILN